MPNISIGSKFVKGWGYWGVGTLALAILVVPICPAEGGGRGFRLLPFPWVGTKRGDPDSSKEEEVARRFLEPLFFALEGTSDNAGSDGVTLAFFC